MKFLIPEKEDPSRVPLHAHKPKGPSVAASSDLQGFFTKAATNEYLEYDPGDWTYTYVATGFSGARGQWRNNPMYTDLSKGPHPTVVAQ